MCERAKLYLDSREFEMSNWFVFQVETGKEDVACDFLNKLLNSQESIAFIPQVETIYKNSKFIRKYFKLE